MSDSIRKNTLVYYLFSFFLNAVVFIPIYILFEQERGLNLAQVSLTVSIYFLTFFVLEVPTGVFADKYGRKISLMLGAALMVIGVCVCIFASNFYHFAISEFIFACSVAFISGADSALIYDALLISGNQDDYLRIEGIGHTLGTLAKVLSFILCFILSKYDLLYPYIATLGTMSATLLVTFAFKETGEAGKKITKKYSFCRMLRDIKHYDGLYAIFLYNALIFGMTRIGAIILYQPYFTYLGMPAEQLGLLYAGLNIATALSASRVGNLINIIGLNRTIILLPISFIVSFAIFMVGNLAASILILIVPALAYGIAVPLIKSITNRIIPDSSERATMLSLQSLTARTTFALFTPIAGFSMEKWGIFSSIIIVILVFGFLTLIIIPYAIKKLK